MRETLLASHKYVFVLTAVCIPQGLHPFLKPLKTANFLFPQFTIMLVLPLGTVHGRVLKVPRSCWTSDTALQRKFSNFE